MDKKQMEMLSVKSAVERMVHNYISTYKELMLARTTNRDTFIDEIKRMMSSFYTGRQVDNWTLTDDRSSIDITFEVNGHKTLLTFLLPFELKLADASKPNYDPYALTEVFTCFANDNSKRSSLVEKLPEPLPTEDQWRKDLEYFANKKNISKPIPAGYFRKESDKKSDDQTWDEYLNNYFNEPKSALSNIPERPKKEQKFWDGEQWKTENELLNENHYNWRSEDRAKRDPAHRGDIYYDTEALCVKVYDGEKWIEMTTDYLRKHATNETNIRVTPTGGLEMYKNGKWVQLPMYKNGTTSTAAPQTDPVSEPQSKEEFDPFEAYERAKKAVRNMG